MLRSELANPRATSVEALLAVDGDPDFHVLPEIDRTRAALARDVQQGDLPADADAVAMHVFTVAACKGYVIFREAIARDLGLDVAEVDARVSAVYDTVLAALAGTAQPKD
jgi:hypothetical protein